MSNLGWSAAQPEVGWRVRMSASIAMPTAAGGIDASSRLSSRGGWTYRGFRCAPPAATDRSASSRPAVRRRTDAIRREQWCAGSEAVDPMGVALSITAGERSHPRTGIHTPLRPHRGRTSRRRRADRGLLRADLWTLGSLAAPRVCLRPTRGNRSWTPMGSSYL